MHILHIASGDLWAGAEVQISTLLKQLIKRGEQVSAIILNEGRLADELIQAGVKVVVIPESQHGLAALIKRVKGQLSVLKPDVIHTHRQKEHIVGSIANAFSLQVPCLRTVHGSPEFSLSFKQRLQTGLDRFCGRFLQQAIVSVDGELTEKLANHFSRDKIHTIANGIDVGDTLLRAEKVLTDKVEPQAKHIAIIGRLEHVKRIDIFLEMAKCMLDAATEEAPYHFHILGGGNLASDLKLQASQLGITNNVTFHGHTDAIQSWIKRMDVVVMTSDHEGLPMTALETLALETPLVAHAVGGLVPLLNAAFPEGLVSEHLPQAYAKATVNAATVSPMVSLPAQYDASENARKVLKLYQALKDN